MKPIAVILPTRNRFGMLMRTLKSLEQQTFKDFTVYVSDDNSTDETRDLSAKSFPGLDIRWTRSASQFPGIVEHFNALYSEAAEPWIALAHDDEVYAPKWLGTLAALAANSPVAGSITLAMTGMLVVDARKQPFSFYGKKTDLPDGFYTSDELKRRLVLEHFDLPGSGFMVAKSAVTQTGPMRGDYEQFDFEWMVRIAEQGVTAVSSKRLSTYMMHAQNTVGSKRYIQRYFNQKHPSEMREEWLMSVKELPGDTVARVRKEMHIERSGARFRTFLKAVATGDRALCLEVLPKLQSDSGLKWHYRMAAQLFCLPVLFFVASLAFKVAINAKASKEHPDLIKVAPAEIAEDFQILFIQ